MRHARRLVGIGRSAIVLGLGCAFAGCMTARTYDGEARETNEVARIRGDLRVSAGAPVSVLLRQVDGYTLSLSESSVDVLPGEHTLLTDCRIQETNSISRHTIKVEVSAGRQYRLVAKTAAGMRACTSVTLEAND